MADHFREHFFNADESHLRLSGIAADCRGHVSLLFDALRRFEFLNRYEDDFHVPGGITVDGFKDTIRFLFAFTNWGTNDSICIELSCQKLPAQACTLHVWTMRRNNNGTNTFAGFFDVGSFCDRNEIDFDNKIESDDDVLSRLDTILALASHVLTNQCQFCCFNGSWKWLCPATLQEDGAFELVKRVVHNEYIHCLDFDSNTPMTYAAAAGRFDLLEILMDAGIKPNGTVVRETIRHWAESEASLHEFIKRLLSTGIDPDSGCSNETPLGLAVAWDDVGLVEMLLTAGAKRVLPIPSESVQGSVYWLLRQALGPFWSVQFA